MREREIKKYILPKNKLLLTLRTVCSRYLGSLVSWSAVTFAKQLGDSLKQLGDSLKQSEGSLKQLGDSLKQLGDSLK